MKRKSVFVVEAEVISSLGSSKALWRSLCEGKSGLSSLEEVFPLNFPGDKRKVGAMLNLKGSFPRLPLLMKMMRDELSLKHLSHAEKIIVGTSFGDLTGSDAGHPERTIHASLNSLKIVKQNISQIVVSSACSSGTDALSLGYLAIASGDYNIVAVLAVDCLCPGKLMQHIALGTQSTDVARPFDKNRNGTSFGEGGGYVLLASEEGLKSLHCSPLARMEGVGFSCDGHDLTAPEPEGRWAAQAIRQAIGKYDRVDYINAHGTGTPLNDLAESKAFFQVFGNQLNDILISSTKGAIGHTLGATGLIEAVLALYSLIEQEVPGTTGLVEKDSEIPFSPIPAGKSIKKPLKKVLSNTFGFGGINSAVLFSNED